ncbi:hypothetical protein CVT24_012965, partial [Panaeolus cyanescens]
MPPGMMGIHDPNIEVAHQRLMQQERLGDETSEEFSRRQSARRRMPIVEDQYWHETGGVGERRGEPFIGVQSPRSQLNNRGVLSPRQTMQQSHQEYGWGQPLDEEAEAARRLTGYVPAYPRQTNFRSSQGGDFRGRGVSEKTSSGIRTVPKVEPVEAMPLFYSHQPGRPMGSQVRFKSEKLDQCYDHESSYEWENNSLLREPGRQRTRGSVQPGLQDCIDRYRATTVERQDNELSRYQQELFEIELPRRSEYLDNEHERYAVLWEDKLGTRIRVPKAESGTNAFKWPTPAKYTGSSDVELFDEWVYSVFQFFRMNGYGGSEYDEYLCTSIGAFLSGNASSWYYERVCSPNRVQKHWTLIEIINGLYDRFVHEVTSRDARDRFFAAKYDTVNGIRGLVMELKKWGQHMPQCPSGYEFKNRVLKTARLSAIVQAGIRYEDAQRYRARYDKPLLSQVKVVDGGSTVKGSAPQYVNDQEEVERPQRVTYSAAATQGSSKDKMGTRLDHGGPHSSQIVCFECKEKGHKATDPKCPKFGQKNRAAGLGRPTKGGAERLANIEEAPEGAGTGAADEE